MRGLLAVAAAEEVTPATATATVVLAAVSMAVIVPAIIICGLCEEPKPRPPPSKRPGVYEGVSGKQSTASSSIPIADTVPAPAPGPTLHPTEASVFDSQPRPTGAMCCC